MKTKYCKRWFEFILLATMLVACSDSQIAATATNVPPTATPTITHPPTATIVPTATAIPLAWKQIYDGQGFQRDTVTAFATDKTDPNVIYAAMKNSGVYKTIDGGLLWQPAHYGLVSMQVESLLIDSQNPRILYASTLGGVFKTEDDGENWRRVGDGTYLLMDLQDNSHLYTRDENGIYETKDQGNTWKSVYALKKDCPDEIHSWAIHPRDGNMLFIGGGETCAGVYQSNDNGHTWVSIGIKDKPNIDALAIGVDEQGNLSIFAPPSVTGPERGMYVSHDGGANWSFTDLDGCDILTSDPDNPTTIYCAANRLYVTRKKGDPWLGIPETHSIVFSTVHIDHPDGRDRIIIGGTDVSTTSDPNVSIFISEDGGISWVQRDNGLGATRTELKIDPLDSTRIYLATYFAREEAAGCMLYRSLDNGISWSLIKWRGGIWCGPTFDSAHVLYMNQGGKLQRSVNGGDTWLWDYDSYHVTAFIDPTLAFALPSNYGSVSANPYLEGLVYDVGDVIWYSSIGGGDWQLSTGSEGSWDARLFYTDQSKMIYAIGRYHQSYSTDNGVTWQNCGEDVTTSRSDSRLALDLQSSRLYLATPGQGVLISTDNCGSWQASNDGLSNLFVNTLAIDPNDANKIYAGTDGGAYISFDSGESWNQINDGLTIPTVVYSIVVDKDGNVYASTPNGIYQLTSK